MYCFSTLNLGALLESNIVREKSISRKNTPVRFLSRVSLKSNSFTSGYLTPLNFHISCQRKRWCLSASSSSYQFQDQTPDFPDKKVKISFDESNQLKIKEDIENDKQSLPQDQLILEKLQRLQQLQQFKQRLSRSQAESTDPSEIKQFQELVDASEEACSAMQLPDGVLDRDVRTFYELYRAGSLDAALEEVPALKSHGLINEGVVKVSELALEEARARNAGEGLLQALEGLVELLKFVIEWDPSDQE